MNTKTSDGLGTMLRRLVEMLDGDVESIYRDEHPFYTPRFTPIMKALAEKEGLSIKSIASRSSISHSAASQTVSRLVQHGLVHVVPDTDRRGRIVTLTEDGLNLLPWLQNRWHATALAANELDGELSQPLSELLTEAIHALEKRSFAERIRANEQGLGGSTS